LKIIARYIGGSHSYGLATPTSDEDDRFVFIHQDIPNIIGLSRYEHQTQQDETHDSQGWEVRHFINLLRRGNSQCYEMLDNQIWQSKTAEFQLIQDNRNNLIDSKRFFTCISGYAVSESRLVLGERSGPLGSKRKESIDKYGYSYRNLVQYIRLMWMATRFFKIGVITANVHIDEEVYNLLYSIKNTPEKYTKEDAYQLMIKYNDIFNKTHKDSKVRYSFNEKAANQIIFDIYYPILKNYTKQLKLAVNT
jgi:predicted nucleotidyltransferase